MADFNNIYGGARTSIHGQVFNSHYSTVDDTVDPDPIQGTDVEVWVERYNSAIIPDSFNSINNMILLGTFNELTIKILSNALRYSEVDSRNALLLDDDFRILYQLGKGLIDMNCMEHTFGLRYIHYLARFNRLPRMRITFNVDPRSLDSDGRPRGELNQHIATHGTNFEADFVKGNPMTKSFFTDQDKARGQLAANFTDNNLVSQGNEFGVDLSLKNPNADATGKVVRQGIEAVNATNQNQKVSAGFRYPLGRWVLEGARCNELILHAAGIKVVQNQWQGEAESVQAIVFEEPGNYTKKTENSGADFKPAYLYRDTNTGSSVDGVDPTIRHFSSDLGYAANTRDPQLTAELEKRAAEAIMKGLSTQLGNVAGAAVNSLFGR